MNVAFTGKFGSGKTTAANYLVEKHGFVKMSLADPMRQIVREIFGIESKSDPRYRRIMQKLGTDWFRSEDPDVWINYLLKRVRDEYRPIVVDDVRFLNEALALVRNGWKIIYLKCPDNVRIERCKARDGHFEDTTMNHFSELGVDVVVEHYELGLIPQSVWIEIDASRNIRLVQKDIKDALSGLGHP